jgi:hypothetical protein
VKPTQTLAQIRMAALASTPPLRWENHNGEGLAVALDGAGVLRQLEQPSSGRRAPRRGTLLAAAVAEAAVERLAVLAQVAASLAANDVIGAALAFAGHLAVTSCPRSESFAGSIPAASMIGSASETRDG